MSRLVLDASALLALINQEVGSERVATVISTACMSAVNAAEVVSKLMDKGFSEIEVRDIFRALRLPIIPFDEEQSFISGLLHADTRNLGLSLGDRACLSLANTVRLSPYQSKLVVVRETPGACATQRIELNFPKD
jgi:PIN domain nuclease of toxin-antitoxin system